MSDASVDHAATPGQAVGVVLAAGASRRMGTPKASLVHDGRTFLAHVLAALRGGGVADVVVVTGDAHDAVVAALPPDAAVSVLRNPSPERGQLSSLKVALAYLQAAHPAATAAVMALVDHPAIAASTVALLCADAGDAAATPIVLPTHHGRRGHPVLFASALWPELLATPDELGARAVVRAEPRRVREVPVDDRGILIDVDTPEDFRALVGASRRA